MLYKYLLLFFCTVLAFAQGNAQIPDTAACKRIAQLLPDSLLKPQTEVKELEGRVTVQVYRNAVTNMPEARLLTRTKYADYRHVLPTVNNILHQPGLSACNCIFVIHFSTAYPGMKRRTLLPADTMYMPSDSIMKIFESNLYSAHHVFVEEGRKLMDTLNLLEQRFNGGVIPVESATSRIDSEKYSVFGFEDIRNVKDSVFVRLWGARNVHQTSIFRLGLSLDGKWYAERFLQGNWVKLPMDERELKEHIIPTLVKLPCPPVYPEAWALHNTYYVEVKVGKRVRYYTLNNIHTYANGYGFWIDKKFQEIVYKLEGK